MTGQTRASKKESTKESPTKGKKKNLLAKRLKLARIDADINQAEMAKRLGVARITYANWEGGKYEPSHDTLKRIADETGKPIGYFYGEEPKLESITKEMSEMRNEIWSIREELKKYGK